MKGYISRIVESQDDEMKYALVEITITVSKKIFPKVNTIHIGECELRQDERDEPN